MEMKTSTLSPTQMKQTHQFATILFTLWSSPEGSYHSKYVQYRIRNIRHEVQEARSEVSHAHEESVSRVTERATFKAF